MKLSHSKIYNDQEAATKKVLLGVMFSPIVIVLSIVTSLSIAS